MTTVAVDAQEWAPRRSAATAGDYVHLRLGPLALGPPQWRTSVGQTHLALADGDEEVVMVDRMTALENHPAIDPADVMADLRHVLGLAHRHVMRVVGAGIDNDIPYVVRRFRLGRPLVEVLKVGPLDRCLGVALLYPVAEGLAFLGGAGPAPGACAVGGFDLRDIWVGYDGGVWITGQGTRRVRLEADADPVQEDLTSLRRLASVVGRAARADLRSALDEVADLPSAQQALRRADREACGRRAELLGGWMRGAFGEVIQAERAQFGLDTLH